MVYFHFIMVRVRSRIVRLFPIALLAIAFPPFARCQEIEPYEFKTEKSQPEDENIEFEISFDEPTVSMGIVKFGLVSASGTIRMKVNREYDQDLSQTLKVGVRLSVKRIGPHSMLLRKRDASPEKFHENAESRTEIKSSENNQEPDNKKKTDFRFYETPAVNFGELLSNSDKELEFNFQVKPNYRKGDVVRQRFQFVVMPSQHYEESSVYSIELIGEKNVTTINSGKFQVGKISESTDVKARKFDVQVRESVRFVYNFLIGNWRFEFRSKAE